MTQEHKYYITQLQAETLKILALKHDLIVSRGPHTGEGSITKLLHALADGRLKLVKGDV